MNLLVSDPGYQFWAQRPEGLTVQEGQSRVCGLVEKKGRFPERVSHIDCPWFPKTDEWLSSRGVYQPQDHALSLFIVFVGSVYSEGNLAMSSVPD